MLLKPAFELNFVKTKEPMETIEIDLDSLDLSSRHGYGDLVEMALDPLAKADPSLCATVWVFHGNSVNFSKNGYSAFFGVAGNKSLLNALDTIFRSTPGLMVRPSDSIYMAQSMCQYHLEGGELWREYEAYLWYAGKADDDPGIDDDDSAHVICTDDPDAEHVDTSDSVRRSSNADEKDGTINGTSDDLHRADLSVASVSRTQMPLRIRRARADASLGSICRTIEEVFGLPEGAVALRGPDRRVLRRDATVGTLRRRWE